jgi:hypothetical protein
MSPSTGQLSLPFLNSPSVTTAPALPSTGKQIKAAILDRHDARRGAILNRARRAMLLLLLSGVESVTADDLCLTAQVPAGIDPRCLGAVPVPLVKAGIIQHEGYRASLRPEAHSRPLRVWRLIDRSKAEQWLADHSAESAVTL